MKMTDRQYTAYKEYLEKLKNTRINRKNLTFTTIPLIRTIAEEFGLYPTEEYLFDNTFKYVKNITFDSIARNFICASILSMIYLENMHLMNSDGVYTQLPETREKPFWGNPYTITDIYMQVSRWINACISLGFNHKSFTNIKHSTIRANIMGYLTKLGYLRLTESFGGTWNNSMRSWTAVTQKTLDLFKRVHDEENTFLEITPDMIFPIVAGNKNCLYTITHEYVHNGVSYPTRDAFMKSDVYKELFDNYTDDHLNTLTVGIQKFQHKKRSILQQGQIVTTYLHALTPGTNGVREVLFAEVLEAKHNIKMNIKMKKKNSLVIAPTVTHDLLFKTDNIDDAIFMAKMLNRKSDIKILEYIKEHATNIGNGMSSIPTEYFDNNSERLYQRGTTRVQGLSSVVKKILFGDTYRELDMSCAIFNSMLGEAKKCGCTDDFSHVENYINNTKEVRNSIAAYVDSEYVDSDFVKLMLTASAYGQNVNDYSVCMDQCHRTMETGVMKALWKHNYRHQSWDATAWWAAVSLVQNDDFVGIVKDHRKAAKYVRHFYYDAKTKTLTNARGHKMRCTKRTSVGKRDMFLNHALERKVLDAIMAFEIDGVPLIKIKGAVACLVHDGIYVDKKILAEYYDDICKFVQEQVGFDPHLSVKN